MDRYTNRSWTFENGKSLKLMIIVAVLGGLTSYRESQGEHLSLMHDQTDCVPCMHQIPKIQPDLNSTKCINYAAQYAAALADLQRAHIAADTAYQAWYECEYGGGGRIPTQTDRSPADISSAGLSVLVEQP